MEKYKLKIGICDDNSYVCSEIEKSVLQYAGEKGHSIEVDIMQSGAELCELLDHTANAPQLLFLDIELGDTTGIEVGNRIRKQMRNHMMQIVYISYRRDYAEKLFKIRPFDFLVKPVSKDAVYEVLDTYLEIFPLEKVYFSYMVDRYISYMACDEIVYFEYHAKKIYMVTMSKTICFYGKMKEVLDQLDPANFWQVHYSYIINRHYVREFRRNEFEMENGAVIGVSKKYKQEILQKLLEIKGQ